MLNAKIVTQIANNSLGEKVPMAFISFSSVLLVLKNNSLLLINEKKSRSIALFSDFLGYDQSKSD